MYAAFNSDDGNLKGVSKEEAEKYEEGLKNPLSRMHFPYEHYIESSNDRYFHKIKRNSPRHDVALSKEEVSAVLAFANLAPLIAEWVADNRWEQMHPQMSGNRNLLEGYKAAVTLIPKP